LHTTKTSMRILQGDMLLQ